ncbi:MAG: hypothetical protein ACLS2V_12970 [Clostridium paraputrificum]|uniref:hypothetical protein n=1 Tax=Clostridium sp. TaxID=1506 RepID=UPI0025C4A443|nr:hypothetical protein [Clostridium sp.]MBS5926219.1 hypothetical protein [Clostridium sp.]
MKKKYVIRGILILIVFLGIVWFNLSQTQKINEVSEEDKINAIQDIVDKTQISEEDSDYISNENFSGMEFDLTNRAEFLNSLTTIDNGRSIANTLDDVFKYVDVINEDCNLDYIPRYFTTNENTIKILYGIDNEEDFIEFVKKIRPLGRLKSFTIDLSSIEESGNDYKFKLILNGNSNITIPVRVSVKESSISYFIERG